MNEIETRSHSHEIEIEAPIEVVWQALTDAAQVVRWYVEKAEIDAREGGRYWVSWGSGMDGESRIETFDPPYRLRLAMQPPASVESAEAAAAIAQLQAPIIEEFHLESSGEVTVLRLVNSGIPDTPEWGDFYDGTKAGWAEYMLALRRLLSEGDEAPLAPQRTQQTDGPDLQAVQSAFDQLGERFDAAAAKNLEAVVQYVLTGDAGGRWVVTVDGGSLQVEEGEHASPTMTLTMSAADYLDLAAGRLLGKEALMQGRMKVSGQTSLIMRWGKLFGR